MTFRTILAAAAASGLLILAGCVTVPQSDLAQAVKEAIQPAVDTFFEELDEALEEEPVVAMVETGLATHHAPDVDEAPDWWLYGWIGPRPEEPEPDASQEAREEWAALATEWDFERELLLEEWVSSQAHHAYDGWGLWSTLGGDPLFVVALHGTGRATGRCHPAADCIPWIEHQIEVSIVGNRTGTNPTIGTALWMGDARAVGPSGKPEEGAAFLEADLDAATIDVAIALETDGPFWADVPMTNGVFSRVDREPRDHFHLGSSISGAFYGAEHEAVAGSFRHERLIGVFGAARVPE